MKAAVKDVMTTRVIWVRKNASFKEMATVLRGQRVSAFPVLDVHDRVISVVSEAELLAKVAALDSEPGVLTGIRRHRPDLRPQHLPAQPRRLAPARRPAQGDPH